MFNLTELKNLFGRLGWIDWDKRTWN